MIHRIGSETSAEILRTDDASASHYQMTIIRNSFTLACIAVEKRRRNYATEFSDRTQREV